MGLQWLVGDKQGKALSFWAPGFGTAKEKTGVLGMLQIESEVVKSVFQGMKKVLKEENITFVESEGKGKFKGIHLFNDEGYKKSFIAVLKKGVSFQNIMAG